MPLGHWVCGKRLIISLFLFSESVSHKLVCFYNEEISMFYTDCQFGLMEYSVYLPRVAMIKCVDYY